MFIIFTILILISAICLAQETTELAQYYCDTVNCDPQQSIACQYTSNPNMKCNGQLRRVNRNLIVDFFNSKRNDIALGIVPGYDQAVKMETIEWNTELEQMARYNVMTCKFGHDKCRNTDNFVQSGQNLYYQWNTNSNLNTDGVVLEGLQAWFDEYQDCDMSYIDSYHNSPNMIGHFTIMVKEDNNRLGCALNKYPSDGGTTYLLACNFATTNIYDEPIYISGPTASECPAGTNPQYYGLCAP
ncbi:antigen 5 like allergen Cul n 1-like [Condylostylus longicornis]|uniref:antigen 5 like allergen Cul n 1-like n=1 Tax=Condylostylus longicornis TaxID=2530218 RepID=UPI00244DFE09|nr:antigen 5 like allergen Cul n 1-like [Condylostylus longicornis]